MFKCQTCKKQIKPGEGMVRRVVKTRDKIYPSREGDPGGKGIEIVEERCECEACAMRNLVA